MSASNDEVIRLSMEIKESFEHDMAELHREVERLGERFDAAGARLDGQEGLNRAGQTNIVRLNDWSENIGLMLAVRDKRLDELEARLRKLEENRR
jgi:hypothetical protein